MKDEAFEEMVVGFPSRTGLIEFAWECWRQMDPMQRECAVESMNESEDLTEAEAEFLHGLAERTEP